MLFKILLFAYLLHLNKYADGWSLVTSIPVEQPEPVIMTLEEYFDSQDTFRLNDEEMGLTAYKDKNFFSCFVNDLDPEWQPKQEDKASLLENQPCEKVNLNTDYKTLKKKAGPKIARMCRDLYIIWLAARNMGPPPLPGSVPQQNTLSCSVISQNSQSREENGKSGNVGADQPYDDDTTPVSQQNAQENKGQDGAPPIRQDGAPLMLQDGAPPMLQDGAPPMLQDGAPPMEQDSAPPMLKDGPPPMLQDGAPPMLQDGAPPMLQDGAPPMLRDGAPPMPRDGAPPMSPDGAPPMFKDGEMRPPLLQNTHSRRDLDALSMIKTPPPLNLLAAFTRAKVEEKIPTIAPFWKKLLRQIKDTNTVAPPTPDMKTPPPPPHFFRRNM